MHIYTLHKERC